MDERKPEETTIAPPAAEQAAPAAPAPESDLIDIEYFMRVKLRVAQVLEAEAVPKSKKLLKLQVDLGPLGKRQILAGIAQYYKPEELVGRRIAVVANLKPASLMGLESQGMLLASSSDDGATLKVIDPGQEMPLGSTVR